MFNPRRRQVQMMPPKYCPTKHHVTEKDCDYLVPVVHPSHTTNVVNHNYKYFHNFPHTESTVHRVNHQQFSCGPGGPRPFGGPMGPMGGQMPPR
ncbi:spore coat protein [Bacillus shivajii]|uniref:CotD family spore coat protein n=1 Tax=Bacillus shivajii TaxID=1983719 RepID=UPI001CFB66FB|nr:CotD family spore coat protein [Bacillus shivajii]UCZ51500.1 spore coat protein [Bacillus shivajii]